MTPRKPLPTARVAAFLVAAATILLVKTAAAQTPVRFSLEGRPDGPAAIYLVPQDKGYYRQEGLDVTIDEGSTLVEPIMRVASGTHDMGLADINLLIRYRDQHPGTPVVAIFM